MPKLLRPRKTEEEFLEGAKADKEWIAEQKIERTQREMKEQKRPKLFRLSAQVAKDLERLGVELERTETDLVTEALDMLFKKYFK